MKRLADIIRFSIISPEFLVLLLSIAITYNFPEFFELVGQKLKGNDELWKFIPTLPFVFVGVTFKISQKLHAPLENTSNKQLYEWSSFNKITDRIIASYLIAILCSAASFSIWFFISDLSEVVLGAILLNAIVISGLTAFQIFLAAQKIRQIVEQYT
ncbi:hypothetical protein AB6C72_25485 [Vibrio splendidus]|uniref:DUF2975 domain-containing protein n=1 Tax=Vibrio splendidus TaxID=29497 RepID=A0A2N7F7J8_VIBSP|nr:hypothetical protein [Vibrio splendidus]PMJ62195.1 hypothetical protein BCU17_04450 [Vibrio splendidus]